MQCKANRDWCPCSICWTKAQLRSDPSDCGAAQLCFKSGKITEHMEPKKPQLFKILFKIDKLPFVTAESCRNAAVMFPWRKHLQSHLSHVHGSRCAIPRLCFSWGRSAEWGQLPGSLPDPHEWRPWHRFCCRGGRGEGAAPTAQPAPDTQSSLVRPEDQLCRAGRRKTILLASCVGHELDN